MIIAWAQAWCIIEHVSLPAYQPALPLSIFCPKSTVSSLPFRFLVLRTYNFLANRFQIPNMTWCMYGFIRQKSVVQNLPKRVRFCSRLKKSQTKNIQIENSHQCNYVLWIGKKVSVCESFSTKNWSEIINFFQVAKNSPYRPCFRRVQQFVCKISILLSRKVENSSVSLSN
jgi:hypothetical protein